MEIRVSVDQVILWKSDNVISTTQLLELQASTMLHITIKQQQTVDYNNEKCQSLK